MNLEPLVRKNILALKPYTSARGDHLTGILMDANENSFGSAAGGELQLELNRYPDPFHNRLRNELGKYLETPKENLFIGVGSDEIIDLLVRIFCEPKKDNTIILDPTYGMYKVVCDINDVESVSVSLDKNFRIDTEKVVKAVNRNTKLIFVCSPNNPTGNLIDTKSIAEIAARFKGIVVIDGAYSDFADGAELLKIVQEYSNIVLLRTFSKAWGLAGVRCGYCITSKNIIDLLYKVKSPYNINKLTSEIVIKALENSSQMDKFVSQIKEEREFLLKELGKINGVLRVYPSDSNFILFECAEPVSIYLKLVEKGIIIRDRSSQIKNCLRVSVGTREENEKFISELQQLV